MKTKTDILLAVMNVIAWIVFVGLIVKAGAILISYGISIGNPEGAKNLYMGWDLYNLRQFDFGHYSASAIMMALIIVSEAYVAFLMTKVLSKIKMTNPFSLEVAKVLERISYIILLIWIEVILYNEHMEWLSKRIPGLQEKLIPGEFLFMAGVVFVIAQIFKKGVEIQTENELTV